MRRLPLCLSAFLITICGCVISPRRTVNGVDTGGGSNSEFSLTVGPSSQTVTAGNIASFTITAQALNGFVGTVSFTATTASSSATPSLSPSSISGGSGTVTLSVQTFTTTPNGDITISVTGVDPDDNVSQTITVDLTVQGSTAAGTAVPANCVTAAASTGMQSATLSTAPNAHSFTAAFDATPSLAGTNGAIGLNAPGTNGQQVFSELVQFSSSGTIQVRDGENFPVSDQIPYAAGETYHFRLVESLPAATYSVFVTPPGGTEMPLGVDLEVPASQKGASSIAGWGAQTTGPDNASLEVCNFKIAGE